MYPCEICGLPRDGKSQYDNSGLPHDCIKELKAELQRLREHASIAVKQGEHWHRLAGAEFERGVVEGRAAQAMIELQGRDRFLSTLDQQLATLNRIGDLGRKLAQDIPRGTNPWADTLLDLADTAKALGIKFDEYPQLGRKSDLPVQRPHETRRHG